MPLDEKPSWKPTVNHNIHHLALSPLPAPSLWPRHFLLPEMGKRYLDIARFSSIQITAPKSENLSSVAFLLGLNFLKEYAAYLEANKNCVDKAMNE